MTTLFTAISSWKDVHFLTALACSKVAVVHIHVQLLPPHCKACSFLQGGFTQEGSKAIQISSTPYAFKYRIV